MKKILLLISAALLACAVSAQSHVIARTHQGTTTFYYPTVDNEVALQLVIDDAAAGDTIHLPGATYTLMDDVVLNKQLVMVGTGVLSDSAQAYGGVTLLATSVGVNFIIQLGADGAELHGIDFTGGNLEVNFGVNQAGTDVDNVFIKRCRFNGLYLGFQATGSLATNVHIRNCVMENLRVYEAQNVQVEGSFIGNAGMRYANGNCFVDNCIFLNTDFSNAPLGVANQDVTYTNNIFTKYTTGTFGITESSWFNNNLAIVRPGGSVSYIGVNANVNNVPSANVSLVFVNADLVNWSNTEDYHLTGPPYTTMGGGGSQVGVYGTAAPWKDGLLPYNPHWVLLQLGSTSTSAGLLNGVHFKASAQQDGIGGPFKITDIRYWWSSQADPPLGSDMRYVGLPTPTASLDTTMDLEFCDFPAGASQWIKFQLLDDHGQWSSVIARQVSVVTAGEPNAVSSITPSGIYCPGDQVTFTANHTVVAPNGASTSFTWTPPVGWSFVPSDSSTIVVTIGNTPGNLSVTANNYCGSSAPYQITITPIQPAVLTSVNGPSGICANSAGVIFTTQTFPGTYHWTAPFGWTFNPPNPLGSTATAVPGPGAQDGNISVYVTNQCGDNSNTVSLPVTVTALPVMPTTVGFWPVEGCTGSIIVLGINAVAGATGYTWDSPWTSPTTGGLSQSFTVGTADGTISVTPTNSCGNGVPLTISFNALQIPATPSAITGPDSVCGATVVQYSVIDDPNADSYDWSYASTDWNWFDGDTNVIIGNAYLTASDVVISVVAHNQCGDSGPSPSISVTALNIPAQPGTISGAIAPCEGAIENYSITAVPEASSYNWGWPLTWGTGNGGTSEDVLVGGLGGDILVNAANMCGASVTSVLPVSVTPVADVPDVTGDLEICAGDLTTLAILNYNPANSYSWSTGGTDSTVTVGAGTYTVTSDNGLGCGASDPSTVTVVEQVVTLDSIIGNVSTGQNGTATVIVLPTPNSDHFIWILPDGWGWDVTDADTTNETAYLVAPPDTGLYSICVYAVSSSGCASDTLCWPIEVEINVGSAEILPWGFVQIFPNPNNGLFTIDLGRSLSTPLKVYDATGRILQVIQTSGRQMAVDLSGLANGGYVLEWQHEGVIERSRVVIER